MIASLSETTPRARKAHTCDDCGGRIPPGDTYLRQCNVDGGEMWTYKAHLLCHALFLNALRKDPSLDADMWCLDAGRDELADWWERFTRFGGAS